MSDNEMRDDLSIENVEIEPLSDEALEDVAGGVISPDALDSAGDSCTSCCSCSACS